MLVTPETKEQSALQQIDEFIQYVNSNPLTEQNVTGVFGLIQSIEGGFTLLNQIRARLNPEKQQGFDDVINTKLQKMFDEDKGDGLGSSLINNTAFLRAVKPKDVQQKIKIMVKAAELNDYSLLYKYLDDESITTDLLAPRSYEIIIRSAIRFMPGPQLNTLLSHPKIKLAFTNNSPSFSFDFIEDAIYRGRPDILNILLTNKDISKVLTEELPNYLNDAGDFVMNAVDVGNKDVLDQLLSNMSVKSALEQKCNAYGFISAAMDKGNPDILKQLLTNNAVTKALKGALETDVLGNSSYKLITEAISNGSVDVLKLLLENGTINHNLNNIFKVDPQKAVELIKSIISTRSQVLEQLLITPVVNSALKASFSMNPTEVYELIHHAINSENPDMLKQLLESRTVSDALRPESSPEKVINACGLIDHAIIGGIPDILNLLLTHNHVIESIKELFKNDSERAIQLMESICSVNGANMTKILASIKNLEGQYRETPLHWAAASGNIPLIQGLVDSGADIMATDNAGATPLDRYSEFLQQQSSGGQIDGDDEITKLLTPPPKPKEVSDGMGNQSASQLPTISVVDTVLHSVFNEFEAEVAQQARRNTKLQFDIDTGGGVLKQIDCLIDIDRTSNGSAPFALLACQIWMIL